MKQKLLLALLLIFSIKTFSQDSTFSLELNYPIPVDENFVGKDYNGIIDLGADLRLVNLNPINVGVSINGGILVNNSNPNNEFQHIKITSYVIQPRVFGELNLESFDKFHPSVGIGYTFMIFNTSGTNNSWEASGASDTKTGFNLNIGIAYDITQKFFAQVQYDFIKLGVEDKVPDITYNTNVNILKIGFGYRI